MAHSSSVAPDFVQRLDTYVGRDRAAPDKDIFHFVLQKLLDRGSFSGALLDVGCATGDFLAFVARHLRHVSLVGIDIEPKLIECARERVDLAGVNLLIGDGVTSRIGKFDVVTSFGTLGIFDTFEPLLENLLANTAAGGRIFVQALLNPDDIDVRIVYRDNLNGLDWMRGFNIFSRTQVERWATAHDLGVTFWDFRMTSCLAKKDALPHRAHTIDLADGTRRTTNGLCLLLPETLMEIRVPA